MARLTEKVMQMLVGGYSKEGDYKKQTDPNWGTYNPISTKSPLHVGSQKRTKHRKHRASPNEISCKLVEPP